MRFPPPLVCCIQQLYITGMKSRGENNAVLFSVKVTYLQVFGANTARKLNLKSVEGEIYKGGLIKFRLGFKA